MSNPILFDHDGYKVLTASWSAAATPASKRTEISYIWTSAFDTKDNAAKTSLSIKFDDFVRYVGDCQAENKLADFTEANLPRIANRYNENPAPMKFGRA